MGRDFAMMVVKLEAVFIVSDVLIFVVSGGPKFFLKEYLF